MIALLIVLTFVVAILIDHLLLRQPIVIAEEAKPETTPRPRPAPAVVGGFSLPEALKFHPGHTWAAAETAELIRVGVDDFAAKVAGNVTSIALPRRGQWVRQGQKVISLHRDGHDVDLVSPIEGTVVEVNDAAARDPKLLKNDPYGEGWLIEVNSPDARTNFKNLLGGTLARRWMDDAAAKLRSFVPMTAGAVAQDGGLIVDDVLRQVPDADWQKVSRELFLTA
jgi:glycine cleavage system H lipoate-binding protein